MASNRWASNRWASMRRTLPLPALPFSIAVAVALGLAGTAGCSPDVVPDPGTLPQCVSLDAGCGEDGKDDCCASDEVAGGQFNRSNDKDYPAQLQAFRLDRYEVTVGRFRAFVAGYALDKPLPEDGANPSVGPSSGWDAGWDDSLPRDQKELLAKIQCDQVYARWTAEPGPNEDQPMNCASWYLGFAFCAWDGGRLPTEAEWNYAAAGGNEQRPYPWGTDEPDATHAVFGCPSDVETCEIPRVGSTPAGQGKWGQMDLAGSMAEWTLDYYGTLPTSCGDRCAALKDSKLGRALRGGDFTRDAATLLTTYRVGIAPEDRQAYIGFRCARAQ
jgi:sulfatase modifying factor 1